MGSFCAERLHRRSDIPRSLISAIMRTKYAGHFRDIQVVTDSKLLYLKSMIRNDFLWQTLRIIEG